MNKPLGHKAYGSIPHLIGSRMGEGDHHAEAGQCRIATEKKRDKHDWICVQEKLDGGNVAIAKLNGEILALTRAGYLAETSQYKTHLAFNQYVKDNKKRFKELLNEGERVCGEWMLTAVGTLYKLPHEPFVPFDLMTNKIRVRYSIFLERVTRFNFPIANPISYGEPFSVESALEVLKTSAHGAIEQVEGAIWRVERKGEIDFLVKYVRPDKQDGKYLDDNIANEVPCEYNYLKDFLA
jgi:ATP-dependent RNA circularization protein (DNA/RNA ligase family)